MIAKFFARRVVAALLLGLLALAPASATVNSTASKSIVLGNGITTTFNFSFVGVAAAYISVILTDASGNETVLTQGSGTTQYQITLNAPVTGAIWGLGGSVTYNPSGTPIPAGSTLTIFRTLPLTQAISLLNQNSLARLGNGAETGLDLGVMQVQQNAETLARSIKAPIVDATPPADLPPIAQRANKGAAFDSLGNLVAGETPSGGVISSAMQPVVNAATLAIGRTSFGLGNIAVQNIGAGLQDDGAGSLRLLPPLVEAASNQTIGAAAHTSRYMASGALTFTLARANTLFSGFYIDVYALTGAITVAIDPHDTVFGQAGGASYSIPKGAVARLSTNAQGAGTWFVDVAGISPRLNVRTFTAVGTSLYTPTAGLIGAIVEVQGGGAGGGGVQGANSLALGSGGGGGGAYARSVLTTAQIGISQVITVGPGGAGAAGFAIGQAGGSSSFGALVVAAGGNGGGGANSGTVAGGGPGGGTGTGQVVVLGSGGNPGLFASIVTVQTASGKGGDSKLGFGAPATIVGSTAGVSGANGQQWGGGGGGGQENNNAAAAAGGAGAQGLVVVTEILAAAF